ncbi:MAG TPA: hypothetical protein VHD14_03035 [Pseudolabrys sp.]|nr:hypothetical protein [Pseudolabrys sp.]
MSNFPWKTTLAVAAILGATAYAFAQLSPGMHGSIGMRGAMSGDMAQTHEQMMQGGDGQGIHGGGMGMHGGGMMRGQGGMRGGGMHGGMSMHGKGMGMHGEAGATASAGQDAFGTIQEIVRTLEADPKTDWSKVNIGALREHLIDMNEVTLHAKTAERMLDNGIEITVTGEGRTLAAIKNMVPAHVVELREIGWNATTDDLVNGVKLTVLASETQPLAKLKALGFMGIMVQGAHHQAHHLMMAKGEFARH